MPYESIDLLQQQPTKDVFGYARDPKKAAGRALGTLVEVITFYLIKNWQYEYNVAIERRLPEYANPDITHNVEFSFHPSSEIAKLEAGEADLPLTARKIHRLLGSPGWSRDGFKSTRLVSNDGILRNGCVLHEDNDRLIVARLVGSTDSGYGISVNRLAPHPFAVMECKRVGVEEGVNKGPQTIEKAKQGAYVARTVSSLQKIRMRDGTAYGVLQMDTGELRYKPYHDFLNQIIASNDRSMLDDFTLTIGIVSNHGNWFTAEDHNKELKVLADSYDWLLFLSDAGLAEFVRSLILEPEERYQAVTEAFHRSYDGTTRGNRFTKVTMALPADSALRDYFRMNAARVEGWFNVISPADAPIGELKNHLETLASKDWEAILQ